MSTIYKIGGVVDVLRPDCCRTQSSSSGSKSDHFGIYIRKFLAVAFCVAFALNAVASDKKVAADSVKVFFRVGKSLYDPALSDNRKTLDGFLEKLRAANDRDGVEKVVVTGYASPEGPDALNARLSRQRAQVVADIIHEKGGIRRNLIETLSPGVNWEELRTLVVQREDVPYRKAILNIIDNTPIWVFDSNGKIVGGRKKSLMDLKGGRPYRWMMRNLFPQLRSAVALMLYLKEEGQPADSLPVAEEIITEDTIISIAEAIDTIPPMPTEAQPETVVRHEYDTRQDWALKTNLAYDAVLMPNLELEWRFADRWSALVSGDIAWWAKESVHRVYRIGFGTAEVRWWPLAKQRWQGWYVGPMAGGGLYDLDRGGGHRGIQGEGVFAGLSGGYMWSIGKHFLVETGLGVGWMYTRYKEYTHLDGHNPYMRTKDMNYFGPISLKLSIGYRFDHVVIKNKK